VSGVNAEGARGAAGEGWYASRAMADLSGQGPPVELSAEETQVMLGRYAGASLAELAASIGLPVERVRSIAVRLARLGLIDPEEGDEEPAPAPEREPAPRRSFTPQPARAHEEQPPPLPEPMPEEEAEVDPAPEKPEETREYRKLFETELRPLSIDERAALAKTATGARLFALCFDPDPGVLAALLENAATTLEHARLAAFHHRDSRGLEELLARAALAADAQVSRRLIHNPATTEAMLRRLLGNKRLLEVYRLLLDRDLPERSRLAVRTLFRARYARAAPEERVELVWATEGRVLALVPDLTFDGRTTQILCTKSFVSVMLIQSLARFSAAPPALLAHLLRQPMVKRQVHLKNQLLKHPNTPSDAKRKA
jgi:hypothetical protein